jgi:hypothetical protein
MRNRLAGASAGAVLLTLVATPAAHAQGASLVGTWQGLYQGIGFQLVVQPNGAFSETERSATMMTMQTGVIQTTGPGMITFVIQDWQPRTQNIYHPTGTVGGYYTQEPTARPPGGTYRIRFNSPNSVTMQDVTMGGVITFQRVG